MVTWDKPSFLLLVNEIEDSGDLLVVQFNQGISAVLDKRTADWPRLHARLVDAQIRRVPVGVCFADEHRIADVGWAERDYLLALTEDQPGDWAWVWFASLGSHPLDKRHPGFPRIARVVDQYRQSSSAAWLVTVGGPDGPELVDVQVLSPEADAHLCAQSNLGW